MIDISALCVHPACVVSLALTPLRTESGRNHAQYNSPQMESIVMNVSGRLLMVQRENGGRIDDTADTRDQLVSFPIRFFSFGVDSQSSGSVVPCFVSKSSS